MASMISWNLSSPRRFLRKVLVVFKLFFLRFLLVFERLFGVLAWGEYTWSKTKETLLLGSRMLVWVKGRFLFFLTRRLSSLLKWIPKVGWIFLSERLMFLESQLLGVVEIDEALTCLIKDKMDLSVVLEFLDDLEIEEMPSWDEISGII